MFSNSFNIVHFDLNFKIKYQIIPTLTEKEGKTL